jgi:hypothetical protein
MDNGTTQQRATHFFFIDAPSEQQELWFRSGEKPLSVDAFHTLVDTPTVSARIQYRTAALVQRRVGGRLERCEDDAPNGKTGFLDAKALAAAQLAFTLGFFILKPVLIKPERKLGTAQVEETLGIVTADEEGPTFAGITGTQGPTPADASAVLRPVLPALEGARGRRARVGGAPECTSPLR